MNICRYRQRVVRLGLVALMVMLLGLQGHAAPQPVTEDEHTVDLYRRLAPATVFLSSLYASGHPLLDPAATSVGAGFILDQDGTVLTNAHVIDRASVIMATLFDGRQTPVEVVGSDSETDLAVLRLPRERGPYATVQLGDSDQLQVGQRALVVGSPFGLGFTLTSGIVSGLGPLPGRRPLTDPRIIQTTAPINPGNSGGPLVDAHGRVVGIATARLVDAQNIGFAVPINTAKAVLADLTQCGRVIRPWVGIGGKVATAEFIGLFTLPLTEGFLVEDVEEESPAAAAGLRAGTMDVLIHGVPWLLGGDIVTAVDGRAVRTAESFQNAMKSLQVGRTIEIEYFRDGVRHHTALVVLERPQRTPRRLSFQGAPTADTRSHGCPVRAGGGRLRH